MTIFRHKNCRSVGVEVLKMTPIPQGDRLSIKIAWWKVGKHPYPIGHTQRIKITRQSWEQDWVVWKPGYSVPTTYKIEEII